MSAHLYLINAEMMTDDLLIERDMLPSDVDFILASWLRSYMSSPVVRHVDKDCYYQKQNVIARRLLASSDVKLLVSAEDPDTIIAWRVSKDRLIHFLYTKQTFRRMGLAKRLVGDPANWLGYTHWTLMSEKLKIPETWVYNPYRQWLP